MRHAVDAATVRQEAPLTKREIRRFFIQTITLTLAMAILYWLGWKSPLARADMHVQVAAAGAPSPPVAAQVKLPTSGGDAANLAGNRIKPLTEH
jgi:hypothetical protein